MARPRIYSPEILEKSKTYLASCGNSYKQIQIGESVSSFGVRTPTFKTILEVNLPSIEGLALALGISRETIYQWEKQKKLNERLEETGELEYQEFSDITSELRAKQAQMLINNAVAGTYNPIISKVLLTKHGYREGMDQTTNDKDLPTPLLNALSNNNSDEENKPA